MIAKQFKYDKKYVMRHMVFLTVSLFFVKSVASEFIMENYKTIVHPPVPSYDCSIYSHQDEFEVHCRGNGLTEIPSNLNTSLNKLFISESKNITVITSKSFDAYKQNLQDVILSDLHNLRVIEEGTFANISTLRTIYIYNAPQIKFIYGLLKGVTCKQFKTLRIVNTGLHEVPELYYLPPENTLFLLDLDHNKIERLYSNSIRVTAQQVTINFNDITKIEDYAFNGSQIGKLHITSNPKLTEIGEFAFKGLLNLRELDLSQTAIKTLPHIGLETLEVLKIRDTPTLHTIPSLYDLQNLKIAKLTHHFHCCAFKFPKQHSPRKHAEYEYNMRQICIQNQKSVQENDFKKRKRSLQFTDYRQPHFSLNNNLNNLSLGDLLPQRDKAPPPQTPLTGHFLDHEKPQFEEEDIYEDMGVFHSSPTKINDTPIEVFCGNISFRTGGEGTSIDLSRLPDVQCLPEPNALNPCEDIMGFKWLRNSVWFVVILAVVGNLAVVVVIWFSKTEISVSRFLICNLAFADLCMGLYLLLIASMDYHSVGSYFNFAYDWQYGIGCQIGGFLTVFSGHLSIFTLTIVTLERWFAIKFAIDLTKRIRLRTAVKIMIGGWIYSILMAMFPLLGISNYSSTSICLPMEVKSVFDKAYLYSIFAINGVSLGLIVFCYAQIYLSLGYETRRTSHKGELTIAKKMALLIFIDFATYTPVAFFGLCALIGYPLINITNSKILLVFFYPLNACANPYLYALMTAQYRRDLYKIVSRCGLCKEKADKYTLRQGRLLVNPTPLLPKLEDNGGPNILGIDWLDVFGVRFEMVNQVNIERRVDEIVKKYPDVVTEKIGKFKFGKVKLYLRENSTPKFFKPRPVPLAFRKKVKDELNRLESLGIITPVETSDWATPLVPVLKENGDIRLCADYRLTVNKALKENITYPLPRVEEIFSKLHKGIHFTKLDLSMAYNQFEVDEEGKKILTWSTHQGLYNVNRLPFGITVASFIFQKYIEQLFINFDNVVTFLDDILLTGENETEHLATLERVLDTLRKAGLTVNPRKCEFFKDQVEYVGHVISKEGLKTNQKKIQAILAAPAPSNLTEVRSVLGEVALPSRTTRTEPDTSSQEIVNQSEIPNQFAPPCINDRPSTSSISTEDITDKTQLEDNEKVVSFPLIDRDRIDSNLNKKITNCSKSKISEKLKQSGNPKTNVSRTGRNIKTPDKFRDFVLMEFD